MTGTGEAGDDKWAAEKPSHPLTEGDFVQFTVGDQTHEGEIAERREQTLLVWEFEEGTPTGEKIEAHIDDHDVTLHPTGRRDYL